MIDHDILPTARNLASHALHCLDAAGKLRLPSGRASIVADKTANLVDHITHRASDDRKVEAERLPSASPTSLVAMYPFSVKHGQRRRDCVALIGAGEVVVLFATWDAFAALCEQLGTVHAASAIMALPADKLLGLARAYIRGRVDWGDKALLLTEANGSGRAWAELSTTLSAPPMWRVTVAAEAPEYGRTSRVEIIGAVHA